MPFLRKYGTGTGADVWIPVVKRAVVDFAVSADWTPASGDVKITIDGAAAANIGTLPTALTMGNTALWKFVFSDAELQGKVIVVTVADSATKAVEDQSFIVETYGHASAKFIADIALANLPANVVQFGGTNGTNSGGRPEVNVSHWLGTAAATPTVAGVSEVDVTHLLGTAWLSPGTAGTPDVNVKLISGDSVAADNAEAFFDGTGYAGTGNTIPTVTTVGTVNALAANSVNASALAADAVTEIWAGSTAPTAGTIADSVWDEATSGHVASGTFGQALFPIRANTAQAGANGSITLDASASAVDDFYKNSLIVVTGGTGANQVRTISGYTGSTKVATITPNWGTNPSSDSVFVNLPNGAIAGASAPTAGEVADAVWDEARSGHVSAGTFGEYAPANVTHFGGTAGAFSGGRAEVNASHAAGTAWGSGAITAGSIATGAITAAKFAAGAIDAAALAADAGTEIGTAVWATTTRILTALDEDSTTLDLDATIRAAVGMASANLDTQFDGVPTDIRTELATELARIDVATSTRMATYTQPTGFLAATFPTTVASTTNITTASGVTLSTAGVDAILDDAIGDSTITLRQAVKAILAASVGKLSGAATTTVTIRNVADSANVIVATVDADGNRSAVTLTV